MQNLGKKYISIFLLITFLISTFTPFVAVYNLEPENQTTKELSEIFGGKLLICTGNGFKWINVADIEQEKEHIPSEHFKCPLCYVAAKVPSAVLSGTSVAISEYAVVAAQAIYSSYQYSPLPKSSAVNIQTRAPPFSFVS